MCESDRATVSESSRAIHRLDRSFRFIRLLYSDPNSSSLSRVVRVLRTQDDSADVITSRRFSAVAAVGHESHHS